jgi:hypothetical protein
MSFTIGTRFTKDLLRPEVKGGSVFNFWRHVRLAGIVMMLISTFIMSIPLLLYGFFTLLIGLTNGLLSVERRLALLEEKEKANEKADEN